MATSRRFQFFIFCTVLICFASLVSLPHAQADEWDGKRKRRPAKREGVTVEMNVISGRIQEVLQSDDNIFLRVGDSENSQWVVIPDKDVSMSQLQVGDSVTLQSGVVMRNYYVKGLKQKFDQVVFSPGIDQTAISQEPSYRDGYDRDGYDRDGHDRDGYNRDSYNRD